ncbi:MAG: ATP-binding cassette domain-containing protein, partial [Gammaproteobacteria bacterium]
QAMVFQRPVMLRRSVSANVEYALKLCGVARAARAQHLRRVLELAGLTALAPRAARVLSGGEQQRLALARAWAMDPRILFLDEPTSNLDPGATRSVEDMIRSIHEAGTKIVMTTHDIGQAKRLADEIVFMYYGRVAEHGESSAFFERPGSEVAAAFVQGQLLW